MIQLEAGQKGKGQELEGPCLLGMCWEQMTGLWLPVGIWMRLRWEAHQAAMRRMSLPLGHRLMYVSISASAQLPVLLKACIIYHSLKCTALPPMS